MLQIRIGSEYLDLDENTSFQFNWHNECFDFEALIANGTLPIEIPLTKPNIVRLKLGNILNIVNRQWEYTVTILFGTIPLMTDVLLKLDEINNVTMKASGNIAFGLAGLSNIDTLLPELELGDEIILADPPTDYEHLNAINNYIVEVWPNVPVNWPMHFNDLFYGEDDDDKNPDFSGFINEYLAGAIYVNPPYNPTTIVPFPYLMEVLKLAFKQAGYRLDGEFPNHPVLSQLMIYNNYSLDKRVTEDTNRVKAHLDNNIDITLTGDTTVLFDTDFAPDGYDPANRYDTSTGYYQIALAGNHELKVRIKYDFDDNGGTLYTLTTRIYRQTSLIHIDIQTRATAGTGTIDIFPPVFPFTNANTGQNLRVDFEITSNVPGTFFSAIINGSYFIVTNLTNLGYNAFDNKYLLNNHVPQITFGDLLTALQSAYKLRFDFDYNKKIVYLNFVQTVLDASPKPIDRKVLKGTVIRNEKLAIKNINYEFQDDDELVKGNFLPFSLTEYVGAFDTFWDLPTPTLLIQSAYVRAEAKYYIVAFEAFVLVWKPGPDGYFDVTIDADAETEIRPKCPPMFMTHKTGHGFEYVVPYIRQKGTSVAYGTGNNPFSLRLVIWEGLQYDKDNNDTFPFATSSNITPNGNSLHDLTLQFQHPNNLYELFWIKWLAILGRDEYFLKKIKYHLLDLQNLLITEKVSFEFANIIMRNISVNLGKKIEVAEAECFICD